MDAAAPQVNIPGLIGKPAAGICGPIVAVENVVERMMRDQSGIGVLVADQREQERSGWQLPIAEAVCASGAHTRNHRLRLMPCEGKLIRTCVFAPHSAGQPIFYHVSTHTEAIPAKPLVILGQ
jgi:hypothetical protein